MSTVTESDIKELKELIGAFREDVNGSFDDIKKELGRLDKRLEVIENRLEDWKPQCLKFLFLLGFMFKSIPSESYTLLKKL